MIYNTNELLHYGGVFVVALVAYAFFWKKNRPLAVVILLSLIGYLAYHVVDWKNVQSGIFVDWGNSGLTGN